MSAIAILSTVMSLALPALQAARESSRTATCAAHLKQIGIAHAAHVARNRAGMAASDWRRNVLMDMEGSRPSLLCPTDARNDLFDINDYAVYIVNNKRTIPLEPGPWCALGDPAFCEQFSGIKRPTPDSFFLVFEDMAYNSPFDGMILAQPLPQGAWKLTHVGSNPHSYRHQLRDPLGVIIADPFAGARLCHAGGGRRGADGHRRGHLVAGRGEPTFRPHQRAVRRWSRGPRRCVGDRPDIARHARPIVVPHHR